MSQGGLLDHSQQNVLEQSGSCDDVSSFDAMAGKSLTQKAENRVDDSAF